MIGEIGEVDENPLCSPTPMNKERKKNRHAGAREQDGKPSTSPIPPTETTTDRLARIRRNLPDAWRIRDDLEE